MQKNSSTIAAATSGGSSSRAFNLRRPPPAASRSYIAPYGNATWQDLPPAPGQSPYHLSLDAVLPASDIQEIISSKKLVFHAAGDTGNYNTSKDAQHVVADAMEADIANSASSADRPRFFYHLGDVVYYNGDGTEYYPQFYEPYLHYPAPIFAIPGNHDGLDGSGHDPSLQHFVENFCATNAAVTGDAGDAPRTAMTQPNVYWTLETPFLTIIGLYSNVPPSGQLDRSNSNAQQQWLANELKTADPNKALMLAVHHPVYSLDRWHGGSTVIEEVLDRAYAAGGRRPDVVLNGHVHNFQRFTEVVGQEQMPHLVLGAGGYLNLHTMKQAYTLPYKVPDPQHNIAQVDDVTLENYCDNRYGFMRLEVTDTLITGKYYAVDRPQAGPGPPAQLIDTFKLDYKSHTFSA